MNTVNNCIHLDLDIVREIHTEVIENFGGSAGIRDIALLESAIAAPQAGFSGKSVYHDIIEIAAAYLYYLCRNHPFLDGNKRTALGACIVFLRLNNMQTARDSSAWEELTLAVAASVLDRDELTERLRKLVK